MRFEVLCEGYHDRAFWKGLLLHHGYEECRKLDGKKIAGGVYGYRFKDKHSLKVIPCGGKPEIRKKAIIRLRQLDIDPLDHLLINLDPDSEDYSDKPCRDMVKGLLNDSSRKYKEKNGHFLLENRGDMTTISLVVWGTRASGGRYLPGQQTLERLVCSAVLTNYPERGPAVGQFLKAEPHGGKVGPKQFAWSYMAKWAGDRGCEDFFNSVWEDPKLAHTLENLLKETGAWQSVAEILPC